jgi:hypothetical protein
MNTNDNSPFDFDFLETNETLAARKDSELIPVQQPQIDDLIDLSDEIEPESEPVQARVMDCICPKCSGKVEIDLDEILDSGFATTCPACNKQIHVIRESAACRARRKSNEISCAVCGKTLDHQAHCHSCGTLFPDYFVSINPDDAKNKARKDFFQKKLADIKELSQSVFQRNSQDAHSDYASSIQTTGTSKGISELVSRKYLTLAIALVIGIGLAATGAFVYKSYTKGKVFAENYIKALYCIKTGVDTNLKTLATLKTEWESAVVAGRGFTLNVNSKEEQRGVKLRSEIDKLMQMLTEPPEKFVQALTGLQAIHKIYLDSEALVKSKANSPRELGLSVDGLIEKMGQSSKDLKSNLPDKLKTELENAKIKYRGLSAF